MPMPLSKNEALLRHFAGSAVLCANIVNPPKTVENRDVLVDRSICIQQFMSARKHMKRVRGSDPLDHADHPAKRQVQVEFLAVAIVRGWQQTGQFNGAR